MANIIKTQAGIVESIGRELRGGRGGFEKLDSINRVRAKRDRAQHGY